MIEVDFISLIVANAPNYIGFVILALFMRQVLNRLLDLIEKLTDDDDN